MKSFFLLLLLGALITTHVFGQTKKTTTTTAPAATKTVEAPKDAFDKFYERLSVSYFGVVTSPTLEDWNSDYAAISPEFSSDGAGGYDPCKNCDTYSFNLWSQVNFAYNFGTRMKFNVIPRWTTFFDTPHKDGAGGKAGQARGENGFLMLEDMLVGFSGVIVSSADKKFNWWIRPGMRLPTSHFSRHYNHPAFGRISYQMEVTNSFTYDFTPMYQLGLTYQKRVWIYEQRWNNSRDRHYIAPNFTITLDDTTKFIGYYELMLENNKRWESINGKEPVYYDMWQNAFIGVDKAITPKLNVMPFLSAYVNDIPFSMNSFWAGAWISYSIK